MVQDWGFNHLYWCQESAVTRVNLKDHSFGDVARTPIEDFDTKTTNQSKITNAYNFPVFTPK